MNTLTNNDNLAENIKKTFADILDDLVTDIHN